MGIENRLAALVQVVLGIAIIYFGQQMLAEGKLKLLR